MTQAPSSGSNLALSVVIPAYNEQRRLPSTLEKLLAPAALAREPFELIVVDDGSTDGTRDIVRSVMSSHPQVRLIENPHSGKAFTIRTGVLAARGRYCLHADADLATPPSEFGKLLDALDQGADVAIGSRAGRPGAPWHRLFMSETWRILVAILVVHGLRDTQCGFKAYRTTVARALYAQALLYSTPAKSLANPRVTAASDVELLMLAKRTGYKVQEVPLLWFHAEDTKVNFIRDSAAGVADLARIRYNLLAGRYNNR